MFFGKKGEEGGGWLRLAAVFAVKSNGLKYYARLTNTQIFCLLSLATFAFGATLRSE